MTEYLTTAEVMACARISERTVYRQTARYRESGGRTGLRYVQHVGGGPLRFRREWVDAWLDGDRLAKPRRLRSA